VNQSQAAARARVLKALAHPVRLLIVDELSRADRCGCELLPLLGVDQSVVSRHLAHLRNAGILTERREGAKVMYHLACPCILQAIECTLAVLKASSSRQAGLLRRSGS